MYTEDITLRRSLRAGGACILLVLLALAITSNANATAVYGTNLGFSDFTGSRSYPLDINGHGLNSPNSTVTSLTVAWAITFSSGLWTYAYTVTYAGNNPPNTNERDCTPCVRQQKVTVVTVRWQIVANG